MTVEADFQRFYGLNPLDLGWYRFCRLLRGLPPESTFVGLLASERERERQLEDSRARRYAFALESGAFDD